MILISIVYFEIGYKTNFRYKRILKYMIKQHSDFYLS